PGAAADDDLLLRGARADRARALEARDHGWPPVQALELARGGPGGRRVRRDAGRPARADALEAARPPGQVRGLHRSPARLRDGPVCDRPLFRGGRRRAGLRPPEVHLLPVLMATAEIIVEERRPVRRITPAARHAEILAPRSEPVSPAVAGRIRRALALLAAVGVLIQPMSLLAGPFLTNKVFE